MLLIIVGLFLFGAGAFCLVWQMWAGIHRPYRYHQSTEEALAEQLWHSCAFMLVLLVLFAILGD